MAAGPTFSLFFSYSHKDEALRDALEEHLALLKREGRVDAWHDRRIGAGREWEGQIDQRLETADLVLLLISPSFMASDYCFDREMQRALERHDAGEARVIPVLLRPCDWKTARFAKLQALPRDIRPVTRWPDRDEAFLDVVSGIRRVLDTLSGTEGGVSPRSGPDDPVPAYLAKVARDHENLIPLFDRSSAPLLDHVYVELELREDERFRVFEVASEGELVKSMTIHQVLALDPAQHAWITKRWVVLGDPGAGKTTLMRHLARELALDEQRALVPVFASLPRLLREKGWLLDRIETQMIQGGEKAKGLATTLDALGKQGELLVQLDGLDEVPRERKNDAASLLRQLSNRWPRTPILVTSRPIGYHHPGEGFRELEVQRFDGEQRLGFLARWLDSAEEARKALTAIDTHRSVRDLAGNPLYLTLMAILVEQGGQPSENRAHLYDQIFQLLLEGRHKRPAQPMPLPNDCRETLRCLSYAMTEANVHSEPVGHIERRFWDDEALKQAARPLIARWDDVRPFLDDLAEKTCIIGPHDGAGADWRYWHRSFREALAAEVLAQRFESGGQAAVLETARAIEGDESRWAEAFALLSGHVDEPDTLVKALVESKRDLGLRALANAPRINVSTIEEILSFTDKVSERVEVFLQIPQLLPDAPSALALIDRMRQETRSASDLFLLDLTARQIAKESRWQDHSRAAEQLRDRLYDHLPPPPEELFDTVETEEGLVSLWCEIPAGRFSMGNASKEECWDDEGPRHDVVIEAEFRLAAVPVTQAQYSVFEPAHRSRFAGDQHPVDGVTWYQAMAFCSWLARRGGYAGARLPTEEEWEFACRAGTSTHYWSGDREEDLSRVGWFDGNSSGQTQPVGQKPANTWGLYDVHGNVFEWTASPWTDDYSNRSNPNRVDPTKAPASLSASALRTRRVVRGGCYWGDSQGARSAYRTLGDPAAANLGQGFRVVLPFAGIRPRS